MNHIDLFSGIGGFALAARWAGIDTEIFCEIDPFCQKVLMKNFHGIPIYPDIKKIDARCYKGYFDILTGGFPCQPFSVAGKKKGIKDDRYLWNEMYRVIRECQPNWIIAENVTGIVGMELDNIYTDLERENYETTSFIIPACAANAPHRRDRLWIVANLMRCRCDNGIYHWESRPIQKNKKWNMEALQQEWEQFKPESWKIMQANDWLSLNAIPSRINNGISTRLDRLRSLGNAIVPQVVYPIMKIIYEIENAKNE